MNNTKLDSIALGLKYSEEALLYRQLESEIEHTPPTQISDDERQYLLLKLEEGKLTASSETKRHLFDDLTSEAGIANLEKELEDIRGKLDIKINLRKSKSAPSVAETFELTGPYFYIAAVIALFNFVITETTDQNTMVQYLKRLRPLFERASEYSKGIEVKAPRIYKKRLDDSSNVESMKESLALWFSSLKQRALCYQTEDGRFRLVIRGLLRGIPYFGNAIDALLFGKQ